MKTGPASGVDSACEVHLPDPNPAVVVRVAGRGHRSDPYSRVVIDVSAIGGDADPDARVVPDLAPGGVYGTHVVSFIRKAGGPMLDTTSLTREGRRSARSEPLVAYPGSGESPLSTRGRVVRPWPGRRGRCHRAGMNRIDSTGPVVQLGTDIDPGVAHYARVALTRLLTAQGRPTVPVHIRIIRDHDPRRVRPVTARVILGTGVPLRVDAETPREAVDLLVERMAGSEQPVAV